MLTKTRREVSFYRDLLKRIAKDLESQAKAETDPKRQAWLAGRAKRIRERLLRGMPEDWKDDDDA